MTRSVAVDVLLGLATCVVLLCSLGVLAMRDAYQRLHYVAPISLVSTLLVAMAITVQQGWDESTGATWLAVAFVLLASPLLSHATARAIHIREHGDWRPAAGQGGQGRRR